MQTLKFKGKVNLVFRIFKQGVVHTKADIFRYFSNINGYKKILQYFVPGRVRLLHSLVNWF